MKAYQRRIARQLASDAARMTDRFFSDTAIADGLVEISGPEHHHMARVMRLKPGDEVRLFDGNGSEFIAEIVELKRTSASLHVLRKLEISRELPFQIVAGVALPKGERQQWLVEKAVELGVSRLVPLITDRGVAQPGDQSWQRMQRWVIAASKQSGRNVLLQIAAAQPAEAFLSQGAVLVAHPASNATPFSHAAKLCATPIVHMAVGPEGGFTDGEIAAALRHDGTLVSLGERILRVETALISMVAGLIYGRV